jgi:hypothetical protein
VTTFFEELCDVPIGRFDPPATPIGFCQRVSDVTSDGAVGYSGSKKKAHGFSCGMNPVSLIGISAETRHTGSEASLSKPLSRSGAVLARPEPRPDGGIPDVGTPVCGWSSTVCGWSSTVCGGSSTVCGGRTPRRQSWEKSESRRCTTVPVGLVEATTDPAQELDPRSESSRQTVSNETETNTRTDIHTNTDTNTRTSTNTNTDTETTGPRSSAVTDPTTVPVPVSGRRSGGPGGRHTAR